MNMQGIDPTRFRSVMGAFPTGVAIIATVTTVGNNLKSVFNNVAGNLQ